MTHWLTVPPRKAPARDPSIIGAAPTEPDQQDLNAAQSQRYLEIVAELSAENEELKAENERLKGRKTYDDVRTEMMKPYADKVYYFLVCYCLFVGVIVVFCGFRLWGFKLSDAVLGVIAGSTAASAIGLVGFVVSGLFGASKAAGSRGRQS